MKEKGNGEQMLFVTENFEIHYSRECEKLVEAISETLHENMERVMGFFQLEKLEEKAAVVIYSDTERYVAHVQECGQDYHEWMVADTFDGRINVLSLEACRRSRFHAQMDREEYARLIVHEFVHICQQQVEPNCYGCIWFWEALATNLAGQAAAPMEIGCSREELMFHYQELSEAYAISYQLGKYMLEHLPYEQIYNYIRKPAALWEDTEMILEAARRNRVNWRKPGVWVVLAAVIGCAGLGGCLRTNPTSSEEGEEAAVAVVHEEEISGAFDSGPQAAFRLPQIYPVRFDPNEIWEAINGGTEGEELGPGVLQRPEEPMELLFASGAGAWGTTLTLQPDGTFTGEYYSQDMTSNPSYPHGTVMLCNFSGRFSEPAPISDYAFSMYLEELETEKPQGEEWIEDSVRYITSEPLGMTDGTEFILYAPETPADTLPEEFCDWWPGAWRWRSGELDRLNCWGLCNVNTGQGFFNYEGGE